MARLKLNQGVTLKRLGYEILELAAVPLGQRSELEDNIKKMFDAKKASGEPENPAIDFVYDTDTKVTIVIPDLQGKRVTRDMEVLRSDPSALADFKIEDIAAECMGEISIRGCGK